MRGWLFSSVKFSTFQLLLKNRREKRNALFCSHQDLVFIFTRNYQKFEKRGNSETFGGKLRRKRERSLEGGAVGGGRSDWIDI